MTFGTVCSGIEAPSVAWPEWEARWFAEIERFPKAVLKHHYPDVPDLGDFTTKEFMDHVRSNPVDVFCGGTPCQGFSVAGLRKGLDDDRSNLALHFLAVVSETRPRWVVWENVPGVLSSNGGRDFGAFLGGLAELGYGYAWRTLDAQHFGVPQRRRRIFVVACPGDWRPAAAVLFERESLQGDLTPSRETGERVAPAVAQGPLYSRTGNERVEADAYVASALRGRPNASHRADSDTYISVNRGGNTIDRNYAKSHGQNNQHVNAGCPNFVLAHGQANAEIGVERRTTLNLNHDGAPIVFNWQSGGDCRQNPSTDATDSRSRSQVPAVGFLPKQGSKAGSIGSAEETGQSLRQGCDSYGVLHYSHDYNQDRIYGVSGDRPAHTAQDSNRSRNILDGMVVRRLTPTECERLQGFPDGYTRIPYRGKDAESCPDGPRYAALGNSIAVPVLKWIGNRIQEVEAM